MFHDCKVYDAKGDLKHIVTAKEQEAISIAECLKGFTAEDRYNVTKFDDDDTTGKLKAYRQKYRDDHKEKTKAYNKQWRIDNPGRN